MNKQLKIVTIGGGSSYTPELIEGFIKRKDILPIKEIWLVDVEEGKEKLEIITALAKRMVKKAGLDIQIYATLNRKEALKDADFITTQFRVGSLDARVLDEMIPAKYGILGQETNGPGGLFKAFRTIPVIFDIIEDAKELAPNAWIVNFANPAGLLTEAVLRYSGWERFIGVCNLPFGMEMGVANMLDVEKSRIRIDFAGLNHMVFGTDVYLDGQSVKDEVMDKMIKQSSSINMKNVHDLPWSPEFLAGMNVIPCSYHRYYFQKDQMLDHQNEELKEGKSRGTIVKGVEEELFKKYADVTLDVKPPELQLRGGAYYSDAACNLIASIVNDTKDVQVVNTRNRGAIDSLRYDEAVEVSCVITKEGPRPISTKPLPAAAEGIIQQIKAFEKQAAKAAISGKYEDALVAMVINPLVQSEKLGKLILDEMLVAHKAHLPQFKAVIDDIEKK